MGRIAWLDLTIPDAGATLEFYQQVVGWSMQPVEIEDAGQRYADFNLLGEDDAPVAGICHARGGNADLPPVWMLYLPLGDLAESLCRVEEEGGTIIKALQGADGAYVYAAIRDPLGVSLALMPG